jgi:1-acyl-sn-glycerol-3-phosphate acyltransferase
LSKPNLFVFSIETIFTFAKVLWLITEAFLMAVLCFPWLSRPSQNIYIMGWSQRVLRAFGLKLQVHHKQLLPAVGGYCLAANHISWVDIQVLNSVVPCRFVSTTEVRSWPVVGKMVEASGALFIDLQDLKNSTRKVSSEMVELLKAQDIVAFFPEATSSTGDVLLPFKANLFQAGVESQTPVFPVCIRYKDAAGQLSTAAGFHGDMTLLECMRNIIRAAPLTVELTILPAADISTPRKALCQHCLTQIESVFFDRN